MMLNPPPGTIMLANMRGSAGSGSLPATIAFSCRTYATSAAYVAASSDPGLLLGIVVRVIS